MALIGTFNQRIQFSGKVGGYRRVFEGQPKILVGGFDWDLNDLPTYGNVLPAGTPVYVDEEARTIKPLYGFKVYEDASDTTLKVEKIFAGTRAKVGMTIGTSKVTAIDSSNEGFDILTMDGAQTAKKDDILYGTVDGKDIKDKVNGLTPYDICLDPDSKAADGDAAWNCLDKPVLVRRMPPVTDEVLANINKNGCFFRWSYRH